MTKLLFGAERFLEALLHAPPTLRRQLAVVTYGLPDRVPLLRALSSHYDISWLFLIPGPEDPEVVELLEHEYSAARLPQEAEPSGGSLPGLMDELPFDLEQLVHLQSWENREGYAPCGNVEAGTDYPFESCFSDTDYELVIARTVADSSPFLESWCFASIDLWVHDPTDTHGYGADDTAVLDQHDYDSSALSGTQCPETDQYLMIGAPATRVKRGDFEIVVPNVSRPCLEAVSQEGFYGGQRVETCFFGVFERHPEPTTVP